MRTMTSVEHRLSEELHDLMTHMRNNYSYERMTVEDYEAFMAVYTALKKTVENLEEGQLVY